MRRFIRSFKSSNHPAYLGMLSLAAFLAGCDLLGDDKASPKGPGGLGSQYVLAVTSSADYTAGNVSAVSSDGKTALNNLLAVHTDAVVRSLGDDGLYIINRLGRDNVMRLDPSDLTVLKQISLPGGGNPYDIAVYGGNYYIACYGTGKILIRDSQGNDSGSIDLKAYADADSLAEVSGLLRVGAKLYAVAQNIDKTTYAPKTARLLEISLPGRTIRSLDLPYGNPQSISQNADGTLLYLTCTGVNADPVTYMPVADGALISVNLASWKVADTLVKEQVVNGNISGATAVKGGLLLSISQAANDRVLFRSSTGDTQTVAQLASYKLGGVAVAEDLGFAYVGDRAKGLHTYSLSDWKEITGSPVNLGLLPVNLAVVR